MANNEFQKDLTRHMRSTQSAGELTPGTTKRRYIPAGGERRHRERIHKESKLADDWKNLPFEFSKPKKPKRQMLIKCDNCGHISSGSVDTVGIICANCHKFSSVSEVTYGQK